MRRRHSPVVAGYDWYLLLIANPDGYVETWRGDRSASSSLTSILLTLLEDAGGKTKTRKISRYVETKICPPLDLVWTLIGNAREMEYLY